ncbi:MAG TPA: alpha/beta fold hydrolase [Actinomycetota bacterium]|nr:alpha/beta fold hydrolase [Actinomycetota bacterium]
MAFLDRPDGARIHYQVAGDPERAPILLLEGLGGDVSGWGRTVSALASELFVVAFDHRGIGRSRSGEAPATMETYAGDGLALMDELRLERFHLYGRSFGGMVGLELVVTHPHRVRSAVLAATHPGHRTALPTADRVPKDRPWLQRFSTSFADDHPEVVEALSRAERWHGRSRAGERRQWDAMRGWDVSERLGEVVVPVLVLHGSGDRLVDPRNAELLASRIPGAELVILEGAGHAYHVEQPERADAAVLDFVRRHRT